MSEAAWRREANAAGLGRILALRAMVSLWQGDFERAYGYAGDSLALLPETELFWRSGDLIVVGIQELSAGRLYAAQNALLEARALAGACQNPQGQLAATGLLAETYLRQGRFEQARQFYQQVRDQAVGSDDMLDDQGAAALGFGAIAYEQDDLDTATREASRGLELGRQRSNSLLQVEAALLLARVEQSRGNGPQAEATLAAQLARTSHRGFAQALLAGQARLALERDDFEAARRWRAGAEVVAADQGADPPISAALAEPQTILAARLLLADSEPAAALTLLEPWVEGARQNGRARDELRASLWVAVAHAALAEHALAAKWLARALTLGQSRGFLRAILDEGEPVRSLLAQYRPKVEAEAPRLKGYLRRLSESRPVAASVGGTHLQTAAPPGPMLFEPLSQQERRVLRLLAVGLSNPEIARELIVSTNTIKTQVQSIYRKLNVNSRAEAGEMARAMKLI
jgi:LuxR family maltose regulon positive regulatory protein